MHCHAQSSLVCPITGSGARLHVENPPNGSQRAIAARCVVLVPKLLHQKFGVCDRARERCLSFGIKFLAPCQCSFSRCTRLRYCTLRAIRYELSCFPLLALQVRSSCEAHCRRCHEFRIPRSVRSPRQPFCSISEPRRSHFGRSYLQKVALAPSLCDGCDGSRGGGTRAHGRRSRPHVGGSCFRPSVARVLIRPELRWLLSPGRTADRLNGSCDFVFGLLGHLGT